MKGAHLSDFSTPSAASLPSGLIVLHGNRCEDLMETVAMWLQRHPLPPLTMDKVLVQSNGMGEWFKTELARLTGVCAATHVQLPARFMWGVYRQVLGAERVPRTSPMDKAPMTWRLFRLIPRLLQGADEAHFAPLRCFLDNPDDDPDHRRYQLAAQLADLFDQYQFYRADWLTAWGQGQAVLIDAQGQTQPLPAEQVWQALLWRALLDELGDVEQHASRAAVHPLFVAHMNRVTRRPFGLPPRIVVFGMSHFPMAFMEGMAALSRFCQVLIAMPNPCRFYWADTLDGRELQRLQRRSHVRHRHPLKDGRDAYALPPSELHIHGHPLLAAWGKSSRDSLLMLEQFDQTAQQQAQWQLGRIDLFDDAPNDAHTPLLRQLQNDIRDLVSLADQTGEPPTVPDGDGSIVFHIAHSPVRELEVLHNRLLDLLADGRVEPRDIVVMMPDVGSQDAAIRAVFGQYPRHDPRHIPFHITDQHLRQGNPMLHALEWMLHLPHDRGRLSEWAALFDVPEIAQAARLSPNDVPHLTDWMTNAGIRWGLNVQHRRHLALDACGEQNSVWFGLQRMLLGYTSGEVGMDQAPPPGLEDVTPLADIGGLEAHQVGALAHVLHHLNVWHSACVTPATPAEWSARALVLLTALFEPVDELGRKTLLALQMALQTWEHIAQEAGCDSGLPLSVFRQAWLKTLDEPFLHRRFRVGGVTFCTLMPMRAIPFQVVCLLGMNDGDYPRHSHRLDFDLLTFPGQQRAGDRSRRDDDRQLMLEALMSARAVLYLSWCGRSPRDNSEQPPSVLVSQLRDHIARVWGAAVLAQRTTEHPLHSFSAQGFDGPPQQRTWAREWCSAHHPPPSAPSLASAPPVSTDETLPPITLAQLHAYLKHPAKTWFRQQLGVVFNEASGAIPNDEPFGMDGLSAYTVFQDISVSLSAYPDDGQDATRIAQRLAHIQRSGQWPIGAQAQALHAQYQHTIGQMLAAWRTAVRRCPQPAPRHRLHATTSSGVVLDDWLDQLRQPLHPEGTPHAPIWLHLTASKLGDKASDKAKREKTTKVRLDKLIEPWLRHVLAQAHGLALGMQIIGQDGCIEVTASPIDHERQAQAQSWVDMLLRTYHQGQGQALPLPLKTALAWINALPDDDKARDKATTAYDGGSYNHAMSGERQDPYWQRLWPDAEALLDHSPFTALAEEVYGPLLQWANSPNVVFIPHPSMAVDSSKK